MCTCTTGADKETNTWQVWCGRAKADRGRRCDSWARGFVGSARHTVGLFPRSACQELAWACSPVSTPYNHALALFQSRLTRTGVIPRTSAVSSTLNPPK